ncbi:arsenate reductase ArsC [Microlunatus lacustris]
MTPAGQTSHPPTVLFVCVHNAGRSQLAAGLAHQHAAGAVEVLSAGTDPDDRVDIVALVALAELGINRSDQVPNRLTADLLDRADVVVALKSGLQLPQQPRGRRESWPLPEPQSWTLEGIRPLRDHLDGCVRQLLDQLIGPNATAGHPDDAAPAGYPQRLHPDAPLTTSQEERR